MEKRNNWGGFWDIRGLIVCVLFLLLSINRSATRIINWVESFLETVAGIRFLYSKIYSHTHARISSYFYNLSFSIAVCLYFWYDICIKNGGKKLSWHVTVTNKLFIWKNMSLVFRKQLLEKINMLFSEWLKDLRIYLNLKEEPDRLLCVWQRDYPEDHNTEAKTPVNL